MKSTVKLTVYTLLKLSFLAACLLLLSSYLPFKKLWQANDVKPFTEWYQINWQGQMVGWSKLELNNSTSSYNVVHEEHFEGRVRGKRMKFSYQFVWTFSKRAPYRLTQGSAILVEPGLKMTTNFANHDKLSIEQVRNGQSNTFIEPPTNYSLSDFLSLRQFIEQQPVKGQRIEFLKLDPHSLEAIEQQYQVIAIPKGRHKRYLLTNLSESASTNVLSFGLSGHVLRQSRARGIELVASTRKPSFNPEMQRDLYTSSGLKVSSSLGELKKIDSLVLTLETGDSDWFEIHPSAKLIDDTISIVRSSTYPANKGERRDWVFYPPSKQIGSLAPKLDDYKTNLETVAELLSFTHNYLYYKATPTNFSIDEVISNGYGDCTEYSQLLLALLNAAKIPARKVGGYIYLGDDERRFGGHEWVEVLIDGKWTGVDPTWNLMHTTAGHFPITLSQEKSASDLVFPGSM